MLSYIMSLQTNIFGVTTFTFHLKILFKKFSQQRVGYHLVKYNKPVQFRPVQSAEISAGQSLQ
jgi:hypothetical protein